MLMYLFPTRCKYNAFFIIQKKCGSFCEKRATIVIGFYIQARMPYI